MAPDLGIIIAIVGSSVAIIGVVITIMFWVRQEANSLRQDDKEDRKDLIGLHRETEASFQDHRKEMAQISRDISLVVKNIEMDMKDFHYKLLEIERSRK